MSETDGAIPRPTRPDEQAVALRLLFQHCSSEVQERRIARARKMLVTGEIDPQGLFILLRDGAIAGAMLGLASAGGIGMVWPPQAADGQPREVVEDDLARHVVSWLRKSGMAIGQCLLHPDEATLSAPLVRHGFNHITALWYLRCSLEPHAIAPSVLPRLKYQALADANLAAFADTLRQTYIHTLDFPEITGAISIEQALSGHRGAGTLLPDRWWLATSEGQAVGVLLLNDMPGEAAWEIAYVGVVAPARGLGFGREMVGKALAEAAAAGVSQLILSVDQRNTVAWQLYRSLGFEPFDSREVFLSTWNQS